MDKKPADRTVVFGFSGLTHDENREICLSPCMPKEWEELPFSIRRREKAAEILGIL